MANRFTEIYNHINSDSSSEGILLRRVFPGDKGRVDEIKTTIEPGNTTEDGSPLYIENEHLFLEPFFKRERMIILGAGHVAVPLSMMAKMTGFYVVVVDDRADFADEARFPYADEVVCQPFELAIDRLSPGTQDYIIIITRGHANDSECIESLMKYEESIYTGLIGSKRRVAMVFDSMKERGFDGERLLRIHTPIGLDIGAKTIEEIDISIMAEVIKVRRKDSIGQALIDRGDHDMQTLSMLKDITMPCVIATIMNDKGSTPRAAGAVMAIFVDGTIIGSIGGGCVEGSVIHRAKEMIGTGQYEIVHATLDGNAAMAEGMVCGGNLVILLEDFNYEENCI